MTQSRGEMQEIYPIEGRQYRFRLTEQGGSVSFHLDGDETEGQDSSISLNIDSRQTGEGVCRTESGRILPFTWAWVGPSAGSGELHLWLDGDLHIFRLAESRRRGGAAGADVSGDILAPMPGAVLNVLVAEGEQVERNQTVVVMESMKMELLITAPRDGVVRRVSVQPGQQVERGMRLMELERATAGGMDPEAPR